MIPNKKGFTLIELLVVITIIGIMSVGGFTQTQSYLAKARDSQRQTSLSAYQGALNAYQLDEQYFPLPAEVASLATLDYMPKIIVDPKASVDTGVGPIIKSLGISFGYRYNTAYSEEDSTATSSYEISVPLESKQLQNKMHANDDLGVGIVGEEKVYEKSSTNEGEAITTQPDDCIIHPVDGSGCSETEG
jgi:prepilin-type N-terminal cleavage/methylation domain-containing protein